MSDPALAARGLSVHFGGVRALSEVDLEVEPGQLLGLIGPNGAGKTTFIDAVSGFVPCQGKVEIDGRDVSRLRPHDRARRGLARTWQAVELFDDLSIAENLAIPAARPSLLSALKEIAAPRPSTSTRVEEALAQVGLDHIADAMPSEISQGQRKLVGVARALAAQPSVLCLDEPVAGLDPNERAEFGVRLRKLVAAGLPMLLIEHDMRLVLGVCDRVVVLEFGKVIAVGSPAEIRRDPKVAGAYLGDSAEGLTDAAAAEA